MLALGGLGSPLLMFTECESSSISLINLRSRETTGEMRISLQLLNQCQIIEVKSYMYIYTARTDVLPGKVRFDCAGPMFCEIPRVVRLGKRMTIFVSLISSTSSSSASSSTTSTSSTSSTSQLNVKFNGGGSLIFPNTLVDLPNWM